MKILKKVLIFVLASVIFGSIFTVSAYKFVANAEAAQAPKVVLEQDALISGLLPLRRLQINSNMRVNGDLAKIQNDGDPFSEYKIQYVIQLIGALGALLTGAYAMFLLCKGISVKTNRSYTLCLAAVMCFLAVGWPVTMFVLGSTPAMSMCGE